MTITEARAIPVPATVILARRIRLAKVASERADADAAQAMSEAATLRAQYEALEAEHHALHGLAA